MKFYSNGKQKHKITLFYCVLHFLYHPHFKCRENCFKNKEKRQANVVIDLCSPGIVRKIHYYIRNGMKRFVVSHICSLVFLVICYPLYKIPIRVLIWLLGKVDHLTPSSWLNYIHIAFTCSNFERCDIVVHCSNHTVL